MDMYRLFRAPRGLRGKLFKLTGPIFLETLLMLTLGVVDTLMLSHHSDNAVAAVGVVNQLLNMVFLLLIMMSLVLFLIGIILWMISYQLLRKRGKNEKESLLWYSSYL